MARSFISLRQLIPRPWDRVSVFWERLIQWARQKDIISVGPDARVRESIYGTTVTYEPRFPWDHPFRGSVNSGSVIIRPGYVGDDMPTLEGIYLDGTDTSGDTAPEPSLKLDRSARPGSDGRSFICLRMLYDVSRRQPKSDEPDWLTIVHVADLDLARTEAGPAVAIEPLLILYWQGSKIDRHHQIVHHNLVHTFLPGTGDGTGRHFFSAV